MLQFFALIAWCTLLVLPALLSRDLADEVTDAAEEWDRAADRAEEGVAVDFRRMAAETQALLDRAGREEPAAAVAARRAESALAEFEADRQPGALERLIDALDRLAEACSGGSRGV